MDLYLFFFSVFFSSRISFQQEKDGDAGNMKVELRIFLPDDSITTVTVLRCQKTDDVFKVCVKQNINRHSIILK